MLRRRLALRGRLVAGTVLVGLSGMLIVDVVAYVSVRATLIGHVDGQLASAMSRARAAASKVSSRGLLPVRPGLLHTPSPFEIEVANAAGRVLVRSSAPITSANSTEAPPRLATVSVARLAGGLARPFNLAAVSGEPFRASVGRLPSGTRLVIGRGRVISGARYVLIATSLAGTRATSAELALVEALATLLVLGVMLGVSALVLRVGLRPLGQMAETAKAIASGNTALRIPAGGSGTELGSLADALNHAFDEKDRSEERLRHFVADASHELRTPLTTISGWADLYAEGALEEPEAVSNAMQRIGEESGRMRRLVEDLLLLARLDREPAMGSEPVDLAAVVSEAVADSYVIDPARALALEIGGGEPGSGAAGGGEAGSGEAGSGAAGSGAAAPGAFAVSGDSERLRQVVRNLIGNAYQHTPVESRVTVTLRHGTAPDLANPDLANPDLANPDLANPDLANPDLANPDLANDVVELEVADDGPGMTPEMAEHAFERFVRGDPSRRRGQGGSGLGLAIVAAIVQAHDGTVAMQAAPGEGCRVVVRLPACAAGASGAGPSPGAYTPPR
ncbi:MAG: sensor histidine kinase [Acidimicrobiales bacterium]